MSTSAITRSTRGAPLGASARRSIERRVREAQAELLRTRGQRKRPRRQVEAAPDGSLAIASREDSCGAE
jgi:hypothetical protein